MFTKSRLSRAGLVLGLALASLPAVAADSPVAGRAFDRLDANRDGRIDSIEMENARAARFKRLDADGDGIISETEQGRAENRIRRQAAMREARLARQFERMDANGDGAVSADEFTDSRPMIQRDSNKDGAISREEFEAALSAARAGAPRRN